MYVYFLLAQVTIFKKSSFVDPNWFPCGSGSSFLLSDADPDPGSQTNAGTMRIRILKRILKVTEKINFFLENIL
jgi:hypothetical protein